MARRACHPGRAGRAHSSVPGRRTRPGGGGATARSAPHSPDSGTPDAAGRAAAGAAPPGAARVGAADRCADRRGRLRQRVPLRRRAASRAALPGPGCRRLPRHDSEDAHPGTRRRLAGRRARDTRRRRGETAQPVQPHAGHRAARRGRPDRGRLPGTAHSPDAARIRTQTQRRHERPGRAAPPRPAAWRHCGHARGTRTACRGHVGGRGRGAWSRYRRGHAGPVLQRAARRGCTASCSGTAGRRCPRSPRAARYSARSSSRCSALPVSRRSAAGADGAGQGAQRRPGGARTPTARNLRRRLGGAPCGSRSDCASPGERPPGTPAGAWTARHAAAVKDHCRVHGPGALRPLSPRS